MNKQRTRILVVDDHSVVRNGLRSLFENAPDFQVVAEAANGEEALALAGKHRPDVAIIDISMPGMNGIETTRLLKQRIPEVKVLILTIYENEEYVQELIREGANGYILKNAEKPELFAAVRSVAAGDRFFSPAISQKIISNYVDQTKARASGQDGLRLTKREQEILGLIARGHTNREIAEKLFLSVRTINTHRTNLMQKLRIHDTAGLVRYAIQKGIVPSEL